MASQKIFFFTFGVFILITSSCSPPKPIFNLEEVPLIPLPTNVEPSDEILLIDHIKSIQVKTLEPSLLRMADDLKSFWKNYTKNELTIVTDGEDHAITFEIESEKFDEVEAYELEIESDEVNIKAGTAEGIYRGIKTLEQLVVLSHLHANSNFLSLPGGEIEDHPSFEYRGAMLDVARHFFSVADVKRYIDLLSSYKINFLHFHLSDDQGWRIEIKSWPKLAEIGGQSEVGGGTGGFYTQEDFREIVQYANDRFITIVPEIDLPGHTNAALASYAELNCNGKATELYTGIEVGFSTLCVDKEETYEFVEDVIREISEMSPGPYFHIGGDESHVKKAYDWDPRSLVPDLDADQIIGLEAPLWTETIEDFDDLALMAFPRIIGHAEIGWTPKKRRNWEDYSQRLSYHGSLLDHLEVKYYGAEEIDWK